MRLTLPLVQKLLIPWIIPKKNFQNLELIKKILFNIMQLMHLLQSKKEKQSKSHHYHLGKKKNILIRVDEEMHHI